MQGIVVEEHAVFTFTALCVTALCVTALCRARRADAVPLQAMVVEGLIEPTGATGHSGAGPEDWQFSAHALRRTRTARAKPSNAIDQGPKAMTYPGEPARTLADIACLDDSP